MKHRLPTSTILPGQPDLDVALRYNAKARRFSLRMSRLDGKITLTIPARAPLQEGLAFLHSKEDWLRDQLQSCPAPVCIGFGSVIPVEGRETCIQQASLRSPRLTDDHLLIGGNPATVARRVQTFLKLMARDRLAAASDHYAGLLNRKVTRITLRDTRSRWGSCTTKGALMYSWRLIMAPPRVLNYVAAHEVAHLIEMNHSDAFWSLVHDLYPGYQEPRSWLRQNGADLHRPRFNN